MKAHSPIHERARAIAKANPSLDPFCVLHACEALEARGEKLADGRVVAEATRRHEANEQWKRIRAITDSVLPELARQRFDLVRPLRISGGRVVVACDGFLAKRYGRIVDEAASRAGVGSVEFEVRA